MCGTNALETSEHFLLHCPTYAYLFDNLRNNNILLLPLVNCLIVQILLFGSDNDYPSVNSIIISSVIEFLIKSKRFDDPLFQQSKYFFTSRLLTPCFEFFIYFFVLFCFVLFRIFVSCRSRTSLAISLVPSGGLG